MTPHKLGIVGLGTIAAVQLRALNALPDLFRLTAACDRAPQTRTRVNVPVHTRLSAFLREGDTDAVLVSVPPAAHADVAKQCLRAGKRVLLEKPAAACLHDACAVYEEARQCGVLLRTAFHAAHGCEVLWARAALPELIRSHGPIAAFDCTFCDPYAENGRILPEKIPLGGCWADSGINALSILARLCDLTVCTPNRKETIEDAACGLPVFCRRTFSAAAADIRITTDWTAGHGEKQTDAAFADGTHLLLLHTAQRAELVQGGKHTVLFRGDGEERLTRQYKGVLAEFARAIDENASDTALSLRLHALLFS